MVALPEEPRDRERVVMRILTDARELIGWEVEVDGHGVGVVLDTSKRLKGMPTLFKIKFKDGRIERLSLKRSRSKGKIPFKLRGATEVAFARMRSQESSVSGGDDGGDAFTSPAGGAAGGSEKGTPGQAPATPNVVTPTHQFAYGSPQRSFSSSSSL
mmetsp:Transcript_23134/g.72083  ORF Transcript_23134/g.72083 Transcript_23134/m.72083 type:complete len:157 (-) Transcript_23134:155-625(-)